MTSLFVCFFLFAVSFAEGQIGPTSYLGFDSNNYPGDANLKVLHQTFSYVGYWLNNPPGASSNGWVGHRAAVLCRGFFDGRTI